MVLIASGLLATGPEFRQSLPVQGINLPADQYVMLRTNYNDRGVFSRYIDLMTSTEYIFREDVDDLRLHQMLSKNKAAVMLPPFIGLELFYDLLQVDVENAYLSSFYRHKLSHRVYGLGIGLPDPKTFKAMVYIKNLNLERETTAAPDFVYNHGRQTEDIYGSLRVVLRKDVVSDTQKLVLGFEYEANDLEDVGNYYYGRLIENHFLADEAFTYPNSRIIAYSYVTDINPQYSEPVFLEGIAPSIRPQSQNSRISYFMGMRYRYDTYKDYSYGGDEHFKHAFRADINLNLTPLLGLDLAYKYDLHQTPTADYDNDTKELTLRANVMDYDFIRVQPQLGFQMISGETDVKKLNPGLSIYLSLGRHSCLRLFGLMVNEWDVEHNPFDIYREDVIGGVSLSLRL